LDEELPIRISEFGTIGGFAGVLSALSGLGGGVIIISILNLRYNVNMIKAKSISLGVIFITSLVMSISNMLEEPKLNFEGIMWGILSGQSP
jgi:uncharacterized membrane protein YfcA